MWWTVPAPSNEVPYGDRCDRITSGSHRHASHHESFGRARARLFRPCDGPIAAALNLHVKGGALAIFAHSRARARGARESAPRRRRVIFGEFVLLCSTAAVAAAL